MNIVNMPIWLRLILSLLLLAMVFLACEVLLWHSKSAKIQYLYNGKPCDNWKLVIVGRGTWRLDSEGKLDFGNPVPKGAWLCRLSGLEQGIMFVERGVPRGDTIVKFEDGHCLSRYSYRGFLFSRATTITVQYYAPN